MSDYELFNGDCLEYMRGLAAGSIDSLITDIPYGNGYAANPIVGKGKSSSNHESKDWDNKRIDFIDVLLRFGNIQVIWGGNYYDLPPTRGWLSWYKPDSPPSMADFELAWTNQDMNARQISCSIASTNAERIGHATQKPLRVMRWCIELLSYPGDVIFDPFMGSGTTGVAALQLGRKFIGCEIDPAYFAIAQKRIAAAALQPPLFTHEPKREQATQEAML